MFAAVLVAVLVFAAVFFGGAGVTMLLVGALHSAVPAIPAMSYIGACWLTVLMMWFRALLAQPVKAN